MNQNVKKVFFWIAIIGWILGLIVHLLSFTGYTSPIFWLLHIGIFFAWAPAIIALQKGAGNNISDFFNYFKSISAPKWLIIIAVVSFIYAFINFALFMESSTKDHDPDMFRGFSGHWMAFYGMAALILYPFGQKEEKKNTETSYMKNYK